jgi:hypothetical protein
MSCLQDAADVAAYGTHGALTGPQECQKQAVGAPISQINLFSIPESFKNTNTKCTHKMEQTKRNQRKKQKETNFVQLIFLSFSVFQIFFFEIFNFFLYIQCKYPSKYA